MRASRRAFCSSRFSGEISPCGFLDAGVEGAWAGAGAGAADGGEGVAARSVLKEKPESWISSASPPESEPSSEWGAVLVSIFVVAGVAGLDLLPFAGLGVLLASVAFASFFCCFFCFFVSGSSAASSPPPPLRTSSTVVSSAPSCCCCWRPKSEVVMKASGSSLAFFARCDSSLVCLRLFHCVCRISRA